VDNCSMPSSPGINFCWPLQGSLQPDNAPVSVTARPQTGKITSIVAYFDGRKVLVSNNNMLLSGVQGSAGTHKITIVAKDSGGHRFQVSHTFTMFYQQSCNPKTDECSPGIVINKPTEPDVPTSFTFQAEVQNNPVPITSMKVLLDNVVVASSGGPGITKQFNLPKNTTHILEVKAVDTSGKQYEEFQTYFVH